MKWKTTDLEWNGGLRHKGTLEDYFEEGPRVSAKPLHARVLVRSAMQIRMARLGSEGAREGEGGSKPCDYGRFMWGGVG